MLLKLSFLAFLPLVYGRQVAVVDLSHTNVAPDRLYPSYAEIVRGGGILRPAPNTRVRSPLRLVVRKIASTSTGNTVQYVAEVVLTNTGAGPIFLPIGIDADALLAAPQRDRTALVFTAALAKSGQGLAQSGATAASNNDHPESSTKLAQGDSVVFLVPIGTRPAGSVSSDEVFVSVQFERKIEDSGVDWVERIGPKLRSENALPFPPEFHEQNGR